MNQSSSPANANDSDDYPEYVEYGISEVLFKNGTPGEHNRVSRVNNPDKQKWTLGAKPAHKSKACDAHYNPNQFNCPNMLQDKFVHDNKTIPRPGVCRVGLVIVSVHTGLEFSTRGTICKNSLRIRREIAVGSWKALYPAFPHCNNWGGRYFQLDTKFDVLAEFFMPLAA